MEGVGSLQVGRSRMGASAGRSKSGRAALGMSRPGNDATPAVVSCDAILAWTASGCTGLFSVRKQDSKFWVPCSTGELATAEASLCPMNVVCSASGARSASRSLSRSPRWTDAASAPVVGQQAHVGEDAHARQVDTRNDERAGRRVEPLKAPVARRVGSHRRAARWSPRRIHDAAPCR